MPATPEINSSNDNILIKNNIGNNCTLTMSNRINSNSNNSNLMTNKSLSNNNNNSICNININPTSTATTTAISTGTITNNNNNNNNISDSTSSLESSKKASDKNNTEKMLNALLERLDEKSLDYLRIKLNNPIDHIVYIYIYYYILLLL